MVGIRRRAAGSSGAFPTIRNPVEGRLRNG
jgi:hypothetical protein